MDERRDETTPGGEATESQTAPVEGLVILSFKTLSPEVGIVVTCPHLMAMSAASPVRQGKMQVCHTIVNVPQNTYRCCQTRNI